MKKIDILKQSLAYDEIGYLAPHQLGLTSNRTSIAFVKTKERGHDRFYAFFDGNSPECYRVNKWGDFLHFQELYDQERKKIIFKYFTDAMMENIL